MPTEPISQRLLAVAEAVTADLRAAPAAAVAAARGGAVWSGASGTLFHEDVRPDERGACRDDTPFDLASVTKPFTALLAARLVRSGHVSWATPLGELLEEARGTPSEGVSLELLLSHRAGLDGHRPLFRPLTEGRPVDREAALHEAAAARREGCAGAPLPEGFGAVYSDLGYLLSGEALARAAGLPLDELVGREVAGPLGLAVGSARALRASHPGFDDAVAPTEVVAFRGGVVRGAVHDENAWALGGSGTCGHAGLFGAASDVARLGSALLDVLSGRRDDWLTATELQRLLSRRPGGSYVLGFDRRSGDAPSSGGRFGPDTFGHLGFTGTSVWIDPSAEIVGVLLTNRVHPTRDHIAIRAARPLAYDRIWEAVFGGHRPHAR